MPDASLHKLVWLVPEEALEATRDAVFAAGAGRVGGVGEYEEVAYELYPPVELER